MRLRISFVALALCSSMCVWGCGDDSSASVDADVDSTTADAGMDTGVPDTGVPDTGAPDTGVPDTGVPDTGMPDSGPTDSLDVLRALGVEIETGSPRSHIDGEPVADGAHPLASTHMALGEISELFGAGFRYRPGYAHNYFLLNDATVTAPDMITPSGDESWADPNAVRSQKSAVGADLDGDGRDEVLTAYAIVRHAGSTYTTEDVKLREIQDQADGFTEVTYSPLAALGDLGDAVGPCLSRYSCLDLAAGDLDGDGDDELVLMSNYNGTLYVLDYASGELSILTQRSLSSSDATMAMVEVVDLDGDGRAEIATAVSAVDRSDGTLAKYGIYDLSGGALVERKTGFLVNSTTQLEYGVNLTAGDFDGDHLPELIFMGSHGSPYYTRLLLMEDGRGLAATGAVGDPFSVLERALPDSGVEYALESGDVDGDGIDEVISGHRMVDLDANTSTLLISTNGSPLIVPGHLAVGDFDDGVSDGKADIAVVWFQMHSSGGTNTGDVNLSIYGAPPAGGSGIVERKRFVLFDGLLSPALDYYYGLSDGGVLAAVNVDNDTRIVEYTGDHTVLYSDPIVMTVLASAPYHADLMHAEGHTTLGNSSTSGFDVSSAVGGNVGFSIGASVESPLWGSAGSFEAKVTVAVAADFLWGSGSEITYSSAIENPAGQDVVVFTAVPFDAYAYRVLVSPDPAEIGEVFSLNIPRAARVLSVEREQYNAHNGDAPDIDHAILQHTVGDPSTYPNLSERDALLAASSFSLMSNMTHTCGGSGAVWSLGCEWSTSTSIGTAVDVSIQSEVTSVTGGLLLGISGGVHYSVELVWHWSDSTFIEGAVGDMLPADWNASRAFDWGVFSYEATIPMQARPVTIVSYWVE